MQFRAENGFRQFWVNRARSHNFGETSFRLTFSKSDMAQVSRCSCELQGGHFYAVLFVSRSGVAGIANHNKHHPNDGSRTSPARQVLEVVSVVLLDVLPGRALLRGALRLARRDRKDFQRRQK